MEWIAGVIDNFFTFIQWVWDFLTTGIYELIKDFLVLLTKAAIYSWVSLQVMALEVAYEAAQGIMSDIGVAEAVRQRWAGLPAEVASALSFFGIPQALNIIFSALSTRFVLKFVPFLGR
ncbi:DUF2523 family protein [Pseudomonas berkeleyensis]|uniref:DUF2523 domain-containing protein n=1 Tax=Pseudomonas berkeleyensis TaxID=2726956 RepID=A0A7G5DHJ8_9PSED|nr:DUF2523 family protein [Pseudomonas berkeleyensis]QMV61223.1 DUF2523 domain-containing protein [Pseudomonas berkeleyensis]QMV64639.1 DUF2523 domain-containing protein [Pseudomonas berkeleyensis]WSO36650.1 DUF2523 family protein [Pseudomonas berkeleyensis]WSO40107.1 DUF2523 family protein [Pseudomonas berkeleyensis]